MRLAAAALALLGSLAAPAAARAVVFQTPEEALAEAWPEAAVERARAYLSEDEAERVEAIAGTPLGSRAVLTWTAAGADGVVGTGYLERHLVRTLPETVLVLVDRAGAVHRVVILSFDEPRDYLPPERWLAQFDGRRLDSELQVKRAIRGLTGATLSGRAVTEAVRRALAVHAVLADREAPR